MSDPRQEHSTGCFPSPSSLIVLALFLNFLGVVYHLREVVVARTKLSGADRYGLSAGSIASERAAQLTSHMEAMGLLKRAKIM